MMSGLRGGHTALLDQLVDAGSTSKLWAWSREIGQRKGTRKESDYLQHICYTALERLRLLCKV